MENTVELYSREGIERQRKRYKSARRGVMLLAAAGLAGCIGLCLAANTLNAGRMELAAVAVSTLAGWAVIAVVLNCLLPAKYQAAHGENMLRGERQTHRGTLTVDKAVTPIRNSISVCRVTVSDGARLNVNSKMAAALQKLTAPVTVYSAYGFVVAYEVEHE